jgi:hypothetical protein
VTPCGECQALGNLIERILPRYRGESRTSEALLADPPQWHGQARRMVLPLGVAGDLGADNAERVSLAGGTANPPEPQPVYALDF